MIRTTVDLDVNFKDFDKGYNNLTNLINLNLTMGEENNENTLDNQVENEPVLKILKFRVEPVKLSENEVMAMIKKFEFFDIKRNETDVGIDRELQIQEINGDKIIFDPISDLVWQHGGTRKSMWYNDAKVQVMEQTPWVISVSLQPARWHSDWAS